MRAGIKGMPVCVFLPVERIGRDSRQESWILHASVFTLPPSLWSNLPGARAKKLGGLL